MKVTFAALCAVLIALLVLGPVSGARAATRRCGQVRKSDGFGNSVFTAIRATNMTCRKATRTIRSWRCCTVASTPGWSCRPTSPIAGLEEAYRCRRGRQAFRFDFAAQGS